jgi:hypothetical protein
VIKVSEWQEKVQCSLDKRNQYETENVNSILTKYMNMNKVCAKMLPKNLGGEQRGKKNKFAYNSQQDCWKRPTCGGGGG